MQCPRCRTGTLVTHARKIEPLQYITDSLVDIAGTIEVNSLPDVHSQQNESMNTPSLPPSTLESLIHAQLAPNENSRDTSAASTSRKNDVSKRSSASLSLQATPALSPRKVSTESSGNSTTPSEKRRGISRMIPIFKASGSRPVPPLPQPVFEHYCFSADGLRLLLWDSAHVWCSLIPAADGPGSIAEWDWRIFAISNSAFVAAGGERLAVVSRTVC